MKYNWQFWVDGQFHDEANLETKIDEEAMEHFMKQYANEIPFHAKDTACVILTGKVNA